MSRSQVAALTGMSKPTASLTLARLLESGVVHETGRTSGRKGPAAVVYGLNAGAGAVIAVDLTRSRIRLVVADLAGQVRGRSDVRTRHRTAAGLIDEVGQTARRAARSAGVPWRSIVGCVVGTPGIVSTETNSLRWANSLPGFSRPGVVDALRRALGLEVVVDNDVDLAAIAEQHHGVAQGVDDFVFVWVGSGIGLGLVLNGQLYRGSQGAAGEIGYLPLGGRRVGARTAGSPGRFEETAGADAVLRSARQLGMTGRLSVDAVFAAARAGDLKARRVVTQEATRIADAVTAVVAVLDPALVVMGGEVGQEDLLVAPIARRLAAVSPLQPPVVASGLGEDAVLHGALVRALDAAQDRVFAKATDAPAGAALSRA